MSRYEEQRAPATTRPRGERLDEAIRAIAVALEQEDPAFARRMRGEPRVERSTTAIVVLLVVSALLLATGLAIGSPWAWFAGAASFLATFVVDARSRHRHPARGRS